MATVKTAISIDSSLFGEVDKLAHKTHLSRSQVFSQAVENLIRRKDNLILFQRLNEAYGGEALPVKPLKRVAARLLKGTWK